MFTITLKNKNDRTLREIHGVDLPRDIEAAMKLIWIGLSASVVIGRVIVTDETTGEEIANQVYAS